jgi:hypothetical protein
MSCFGQVRIAGRATRVRMGLDFGYETYSVLKFLVFSHPNIHFTLLTSSFNTCMMQCPSHYLLCLLFRFTHYYFLYIKPTHPSPPCTIYDVRTLPKKVIINEDAETNLRNGST